MALDFDTCLSTGTVACVLLGSISLFLIILVLVSLMSRKKIVKKLHDEEENKLAITTPMNVHQASAQQNLLHLGHTNTYGGVVERHNLHQRLFMASSPSRDAHIHPWSPYDLGTCDISATRYWLSQQEKRALITDSSIDLSFTTRADPALGSMGASSDLEDELLANSQSGRDPYSGMYAHIGSQFAADRSDPLVCIPLELTLDNLAYLRLASEMVERVAFDVVSQSDTGSNIEFQSWTDTTLANSRASTACNSDEDRFLGKSGFSPIDLISVDGILSDESEIKVTAIEVPTAVSTIVLTRNIEDDSASTRKT